MSKKTGAPAGFLDRLSAGTLVFDGAMGTMLYERGIFLNRSFEEVCLSDPRLVLGIHREYLEAGAEVLGILSIFCGPFWGTVSDFIGRKCGLALVFLTQGTSYLFFGLLKSDIGYLLSTILFGLTAWSVPSIISAAVGDTVGPRLAPAALGFTILVMGIVLAVRNRVTDNLRTLVKLTNDLRQQRLRADYPVSLAEFQMPLETMLKLGKVMLGKQKEVSSQARLDHLSQVNNRRAFDEKQKELFATLKDGWTHSLLILDIDNFKQVNDTFGHEAGDQLIIKFGNVLKGCLRNSDFIARLGGDEFCVLFPYTQLDRAQELAERLRANMPESVELIPGVTQKLSWSGGLSEYSRDDHGENEALARADAALLEAKRSGRNATRVRAAA